MLLGGLLLLLSLGPAFAIVRDVDAASLQRAFNASDKLLLVEWFDPG
jgi:hypothetical protein